MDCYCEQFCYCKQLWTAHWGTSTSMESCYLNRASTPLPHPSIASVVKTISKLNGNNKDVGDKAVGNGWRNSKSCTFGLAWKEKWGWPQDEIFVIKGRDEQGMVKSFLSAIKVAVFTLLKDIVPVLPVSCMCNIWVPPVWLFAVVGWLVVCLSVVIKVVTSIFLKLEKPQTLCLYGWSNAGSLFYITLLVTEKPWQRCFSSISVEASLNGRWETWVV